VRVAAAPFSASEPPLAASTPLPVAIANPKDAFMHTREKLAGDIRILGIDPSDTVMLHASIRSVGEVAGGPDQIHLALRDVLTPKGTLLMYAGCPRYYDEVGSGILTKEHEQEIIEKLPVFDALTARSDRENGALVELFRTNPDSRVNRHVARFVVWGKQADYLISEQPWDYAFGLHSALDRFLELDGKIVLLGSDHDAVTFLHYVEHVANIPTKKSGDSKCPFWKMDGGYGEAWRSSTLRATALTRIGRTGFAQIVDAHIAATRNKGGKIGNALSYVLHARALLDFARPVMEAVASEPRVTHNLNNGDVHP
jgi:aminoglycoside 3-N-acetyltransferase